MYVGVPSAMPTEVASCLPVASLTAFAIAGALNWIAHWYREDQALTAAEVGDAFVAFFDKGLLPRPGGTMPARA